MSFLEIVKQNCEFDNMLLNRVKEIPQPRIEGRLKLRTKGGHNQTYIKLKGDADYKYAAKSDGEAQGKVNRLKLKYFLNMSQNVLEENVRLQKNFIENYVPYSFEHVNEMLPPAYRYETPQRIFSNVDRSSQNPYRRDLLIHMTSAGIFVRSKGEVVVTDTLVSIGANFYYERALELVDEYGRKRIVYPDFTIFLDNAVYYWEHEGMLSDPLYFERSQEKKKLYHLNGIYEPKNLIVTAEGADGSIDSEAMKRLACGLLLPLM